MVFLGIEREQEKKQEPKNVLDESQKRKERRKCEKLFLLPGPITAESVPFHGLHGEEVFIFLLLLLLHLLLLLLLHLLLQVLILLVFYPTCPPAPAPTPARW